MDKIKKTLITIDCSQYLPPSFGKCNRLHGHTYKIVNLIITTSRTVDFSLIKKIVNAPDHKIFAPEKHRRFWEAVQALRDSYEDGTLPQFVCQYYPVDEITVEALGREMRKEILDIPGVLTVEFELYETPTQCTIIDKELY